MPDSTLTQLRNLLMTLRSELTNTEQTPTPADPSAAENYRVLVKMAHVAIATLEAAIVTIEAIENATAVYAALHSSSKRELLN